MLSESHTSTAQSKKSRQKTGPSARKPFAGTTATTRAAGKSATVLSRKALDNTAQTRRVGTVRDTGNLIEDIFFTYTGCESIDAFLDLQEAGSQLAESIVQGSAFTHREVQPQVPLLLEQWTAHKLKSSTSTAAPAPTSATNGGTGSSSNNHHATTKRDMCSYSNVPKAPTVLPRLAASLTGTSDAGDLVAAEDGPSTTPLLPSLEELPPVQRCDEAAVRTLRTRVDAHLRRLVHLVQLTHALEARWGLLSESERLTLHNAMAGLARTMMTRQEIMNTFTHLQFRDEGLEAVSEELDDCECVETLVVSDNAKLTAVEHVPPHTHTLLASACALARLDFASLAFIPSVCVLGLSFNRFQSIGFIAQLPSLRILDISHNELADTTAVTDDLNAHATLEEVTLLGNPLALVEGYRRLVGAQCPNLRTLDGFALQSREREPFSLEDYTQYEQHVHPPPPPVTGKRAGGLGTSSGTAADGALTRRKVSQQHSGRQATGASRLSQATDRTVSVIVAGDEAASAEKTAPVFTDVLDEYERSVEATAEVLQVTGLSSLLDEPLTVGSEEELQPFATWVLEAAGLTRGDDPSQAWRLPPNARVSAAVLERVLAAMPGGGPAPSAASTAAASAAALTASALLSTDPPSIRGTRSRPDVTELSAHIEPSVAGSGPSSPLPATGASGKRGQANKAPQRVPLYDTTSVVTVRGTWPSDDQRDEAEAAPAWTTQADNTTTTSASLSPCAGGVAMCVRVFDSADYQVDGAVGSALGLFNASLPSTSEDGAAGAGAITTARVVTPPASGARQGPVGKLRKAVAATVVDNTALLNQSFTADLPLCPSLARHLRQPVRLTVSVDDTLLVWNAEARKALLDGGGPSSHKALQKAVLCSVAAATGQQPLGHAPSSPPRTHVNSRVSSAAPARAAVAERLNAVQADLSSSSSAAQSVTTAFAPPSPPSPKPVLVHRTYHLGTITLYPDDLLSQNTHLRPARTPAAASTSTRSNNNNSSGGAGGGGGSGTASGVSSSSGSSKKAPRPVLQGAAAELPCARELFLRGVPLERSAKDAEALARDIGLAQADLCVCLDTYAAAYEQVVLRRKELATSNNASTTTFVGGAGSGHSLSISLAGTLPSASGLLGGTQNGSSPAAVSAAGAHTRTRHNTSGGAGIGNSAAGGRRQSVKPPSAEALALQQWQKGLEPWRAAVTDCAVHVLAAKARAAALARVDLQLDVRLQLGRGPLPPLPPDEEARQPPAVTRDKQPKNK